MNTAQFIAAYNESRNGANCLVRHPLVRSFLYSDGVQECAEAGAYWLLDVLATEIPGMMRESGLGLAVVKVAVKDGEATITCEKWDDDDNPYRRHVTWTDLPEGEWLFYVADNGDRTFTCILPSEY